MKTNNQNDKISLLFLLSIANLLAAFGGGAVLQRAIAEVTEMSAFTKKHDEAVIAFLIGTVIGLILIVLLEVVKSKWRRISRKAGGFLCFGGALISLMLIPIYVQHLGEHKRDPNHVLDWHFIAFYILLSILFSLLFVPRILRSDIAAGDRQKIGWVEFCYSAGMVIGILVWTGITKWRGSIDFVWVLGINAGFQILAGLMDIYSGHLTPLPAEANGSTGKRKVILPLNRGLYTMVTVAVVALTIGVQAVSIEFRHALGPFPGIILFASFYFGAGVASLMFGMIKTKLELPYLAQGGFASGFLVLHLWGKARRFSFISFSILAALPLLLAVAFNLYRVVRYCSGDINCPIDNLTVGVFVLLVAVSAFIFEWVVLALLNFVGMEAKETNREGLVAVTFGLMGIGAATSIGLFTWLGINIVGHYAWLTASVICIIVANIAIRSTNRKVRTAPALQPN